MANSIKMSVELDGKDALKTLQAIGKGFENTGNEVEKVTKKTSVFGDVLKAQLTSIVAVNFGGLLRSQISEAIRGFRDFETGLINTAKTANLSQKEIEKLGSNLDKLTRTLPVTAKELTEITTAAGQLGVKGTKNLTKFADTIAKLGKVSDISGDEAATSITRILNVTGEGIDTIDEFASGIVALGNNFAATESEIVLMTNEVARATAQFGVSSGEAAALSATLKSFGVRAEEAGSVLSKSFQAIETAIKGGGKELKALERITGESAEALRKQYGEDTLKVFQKFLLGTQRLTSENANLKEEFEAVGISGIRVAKVLPTLSANYDELSRALTTYSEGSQDAIALNEEFERSLNTLDSRAQLLENTYNSFSRELVGAFAPAVTGALKSWTGWLQVLRADTPIEKAEARVGELEGQIQDVTETAKLFSGFISKEWFPATARLNEAMNESKIADLNADLEETVKVLEKLQPLDPAESIKNIEKQLADLAQTGADPLLNSVYGTTQENEAKKAQLITQLENLRNIQSLHNGELNAIEDKNNEEEVTRKQEQFNVLKELQAEQKEFNKELKEVEDEEKVELEAVDLEALILSLGEREAIKEVARIQEITNETKQKEALKKLREKALKEQKKKDEAAAKAQLALDANVSRQKISIAQNTSALLSEVLGSESKIAFLVAKGAAAGSVLLSTATALASVPAQVAPIGIAGGPLAAKAAAARLTSLIKINSGIQLATIAASAIKGFADGGIVGGTSQTGDKQLIRANAGERILTARENRVLTESINENSLGGNSTNVTINNPIMLSEDGVDEVIDQINDAVEFRNKELRAS